MYSLLNPWGGMLHKQSIEGFRSKEGKQTSVECDAMSHEIDNSINIQVLICTLSLRGGRWLLCLK